MSRRSEIYRAVCEATEDKEVQTECWVDSVELPFDMFAPKWEQWLMVNERTVEGEFALDPIFEYEGYEGWGDNID